MEEQHFEENLQGTKYPKKRTHDNTILVANKKESHLNNFTVNETKQINEHIEDNIYPKQNQLPEEKKRKKDINSSTNFDDKYAQEIMQECQICLQEHSLCEFKNLEQCNHKICHEVIIYLL
jgi:hypothetical protein